MRTTLRIAAATALVLLGAALLARRAGERPAPPSDAPTAGAIRVLPPDSTIAGSVETDSTIGEYKVRLVRDTIANDRIADVWRHGHRVYAIRAADVRLENVGRDLTGDRVPDVVVQIFTGGIHCCTQATVLSLGPTLQTIATIDGADGDVVFDDIDDNGIPEVKISDFRFAYWREYSFAETQAPDVILAWRDGAYRAACDLMKERAPSAATLQSRARELTAGWASGDPPAAFWGYAVDLIYSGHPGLAWQFLDRNWPSGIGGREEFIADLKDRLRGSACWSPPEGARPAT